jgi:hypothetical protein
MAKQRLSSPAMPEREVHENNICHPRRARSAREGDPGSPTGTVCSITPSLPSGLERASLATWVPFPSHTRCRAPARPGMTAKEGMTFIAHSPRKATS